MVPWRCSPRHRASKPWRHTMAPGAGSDHSTQMEKDLVVWDGRIPRRHGVGHRTLVPWRHSPWSRASKPWRHTMASGAGSNHSTGRKNDLVIWEGRIPRRHRAGRRAMIPWRHRARRHAMIPWRHGLGHRASKLKHSKQILVHLTTKVHFIKVPKCEITVHIIIRSSTLIHEVEFTTNIGSHHYKVQH
jgi:hypothetical protein